MAELYLYVLGKNFKLARVENTKNFFLNANSLREFLLRVMISSQKKGGGGKKEEKRRIRKRIGTRIEDRDF